MNKPKLNAELNDSQAHVVPDDIFKIKMNDAPPIEVDDDNQDKRPDKPYLYIRQAKKAFNENTIRALLKNIPIYHIHHQAAKNTFFVYFNFITDMEDSFRILNNVNFDLHIEVGQPKKIEEEMKELSLAETNYSENSIDKKSRTIMVSDVNPQHPNFTPRKILIPLTEYEREGSIIAKNDPMKRYFHVTFEHVLETCGVFNINNIKINEHWEYAFRHGRLIQKFTGLNVDEATSECMCTPEEMAKTLEEHNYKKCYNCGQYCASYCPECLTPFCSTICEQKMREDHDVSCSKKFALSFVSPPPKDVENMFLVDHMPANRTDVEITAFLRSNIVFVRSLNSKANDGYLHVLDEVRKQSKNAKNLVDIPICGQLVLLKIDSEYLRALVLNAEQPSGIYLICVDYGNVEFQPLNNLYEIPSTLEILPRYVVPVQLKAVPVCFMNAKYRKMLYFFLTRRRVTIEYGTRDFDYDTRLPKVVLRTEKLKRSINEEIIAQNAVKEPGMNAEICFDNMLLKAPLTAGSNVELVIMDNTLIKVGIISCTVPEFSYEIQKIVNDIQIYGNSLKPMSYAPQVNELCIAYYEEDNKWCRGRCLELVGDGFPTISFLDYGNVYCITVENIRPYPEMFLSFPLLTSDVEIIDLPSKMDEPTIQKLQKQLPIGSKIKCDLYYDEKEKYYYINLPKD